MLSRHIAKLSILYAEDDEYIRANAVEYLERTFCNVYQARDGEEGLKCYYKYKPSIIIVDIEMPKLNGLEFISIIREKDPITPIIITTAHSCKDYLLKATELYLVKYIIKPFTINDIEEALEQAYNSLFAHNSLVMLNGRTYYDLDDKILIRDKEIVKLGYKETLLLYLLVKNPKRIVHYKEIEDLLWEDNKSHKDAMRSLVLRLKSKGGLDIRNYSKVGYRCHI